MSAQDPQKLAYPQTYPGPLKTCVCGHLVTVHFLSEKTQERMDCSAWRGGKCRCKRFEAVEE